ncbi:hypothetical protein K469DRAFT_277920 [Zopfia rhizophila CBS 207.26]|uniref:Uncharacterized protein n=1 Tax=Zopfia rhizophila CBS 207.26 TaxID=1314779 RepID=A0A6A6DMX8_9PEZI|nr:hypothetical protein K469DRAFT_277920 [Zopfia rhizophila CBS 207.26]
MQYLFPKVFLHFQLSRRDPNSPNPMGDEYGFILHNLRHPYLYSPSFPSLLACIPLLSHQYILGHSHLASDPS